jgi:hypothetical protein
MAYPDPQAAARRSVERRIQRFLDSIRHDRTRVSIDQHANLALAIACLERADYPSAEDAMMLVEKDWAPRFPPAREPAAVPELVAHFGRLIAHASNGASGS